MRYVALLRGINVGGKNKIDMKQLVAALTAAGFTGVEHYLNTGNIFFETNDISAAAEARVTQTIQDTFGLDIKVLLQTSSAIKNIASRIPDNWTNDSDTKCNVMFLWPPYNTPQTLQDITARDAIDEVFFESGALVWRTRQADFNRSGMGKIASSTLYKHMTIRNVNTFRAIAERM